jgi:hypothetical protein
MIQQQNYSLAALAKRDAQADPFGKAALPEPKADLKPEPTPPKSLSDSELEMLYGAELRREYARD